MSDIKVLQIGMGPLGIKIAEFIKQRSSIRTVGAVDKNPQLINKSLKDLSDSLDSNIKISNSISETLGTEKPDVAILTTVSNLEKIAVQIEEIVSYGIPVVSTCEELSYSWDTNPSLSEKMDLHAKEHNVAIIGTGVNPGFLMDALPSFLTSICQRVDSIKISRFQDASFRRIPFQQKIGAGLTLEEFDLKKTNGTLRHVGLTESIQFIAHQLGWSLSKTTDHISPVLAKEAYQNQHLTIKKGNATGVRQIGSGYVNDELKIELIFQAAVGEESSYDEIEITGSPNIKSKIDGGVNGDIATCAISVNAAKSIIQSKPGLRSMADMPMPSYFQ